MDTIEYLLSPIIWVMDAVLNAFYTFTGSIGLSILLLSFTFALIALPLQKKGQRIEREINEKISVIDNELKPLKASLKGEELFLATEEVYKKHNFHPIKSIATGTSFLVMLPILISAIFLFSNNPLLAHKEFFFIDNLAEPDGSFNLVNVLPFIMLSVTLIDSKLRYKNNKQAQRRFMLIAFVLLVLVYNMPSALVLYWTGSNIFSLISNNHKLNKFNSR